MSESGVDPLNTARLVTPLPSPSNTHMGNLRSVTVKDVDGRLEILNSGIVVDFDKKKALKKSTLPRKKHHIFSKKSTHFTNKKHFWSRKKHLINIILLTKSNNDGEKCYIFRSSIKPFKIPVQYLTHLTFTNSLCNI